MRTHLHFKLVCALICLPFIAFANNSWKGRYTKEKTIKNFEFSEIIPLPKNWGGYLVTPSEMEFWQGRPSRLHDRFSYKTKDLSNWTIERLAP